MAQQPADFLQDRVLWLSEHGPDGSTPHPLAVLALEGQEHVNALFEYRLTVQTPDLEPGRAPPVFDPAAWLGRQLTVHIELDGHGTYHPGAPAAQAPGQGRGTREISGIVAKAGVLDSDARHITASLTLRPWLLEATLTSNCRIFQDMTVIEVIDTLFADYVWPLDKRLVTPYPQRDICIQYNETDYEFFLRITQEWGINHHFEHSDGRHALVLSDYNSAFQRFQPLRTRAGDTSPYHEIPVHPPGHRTDREYIHAFVLEQSVSSIAWEAQDYDYVRPRAMMRAHAGAHAIQGQRQLRQIYTWRGDHAGLGGADWSQPDAGANRSDRNADQADQLAAVRLEALAQHAQRGRGEGHVRGIVAGCLFRLTDHAHEAANIEHLVLGTQLTIEAPGQESQPGHASGRWRIDVRFHTQPATVPLRPDATQPKPRVHGVESAVVTGPTDADPHTDYLHRIKVRFHWDRSGRTDHTSSCWLRVVTPWAGNQLGATFVPRPGQEVAVAFFGGDPDLPIVIGSVHNDANQPSWQLPGQVAIAGFRSRELIEGQGNAYSGRSNHFALDDTPGRIQVQIKSDHLHSSLSLGHVARIENHQGRQDERGEGFELRTDGVGALRSGRGMLIATDARENARSHLQDTGEASVRLEAAREQHERLGALAQQHGVQDDDASQQAIGRDLRTGNDEVAGRPGSPTGFAQLVQPHLVLSSAADLAACANRDLQLTAGHDVAVTSAGHTSISSGGSLLASALGGIRLFARQLGVRLFAARGAVQIQAQDDRIELIARKARELISTTDWIHLKAKAGIALGVGDTTLHITDAGFRFHTRGVHHVWAGDHQTFGPRVLANPLPPMPDGVCIPCLLKAAEGGSPLARL